MSHDGRATCSRELQLVSSPKSPLHALVQTIQTNHESCERHEHATLGQAPSSRAWRVASLMHVWHRGRDPSSAFVTAASEASEPAEKARKDAKAENGGAFSLAPKKEQELLAASSGNCIATFCVRFDCDLLHGELQATEDWPRAVLARFELTVARQLERSYVQDSLLSVTEVTYDAKCDSLNFTLDPVCEDKEQQNKELMERVNYLSEVIEGGLFWIEYPESNLNFCPPQAAQVRVTKRT